ncbi:unnamed protein product [Colias eurytheme]|nr:unnamed protein product [Colias eurytheme]
MHVWVLVCACAALCEGKQMSETLQRALSAVRGPSPGAKKLLNIPDDGEDPITGITASRRLKLRHDWPKRREAFAERFLYP